MQVNIQSIRVTESGFDLTTELNGDFSEKHINSVDATREMLDFMFEPEVKCITCDNGDFFYCRKPFVEKDIKNYVSVTYFKTDCRKLIEDIMSTPVCHVRKLRSGDTVSEKDRFISPRGDKTIFLNDKEIAWVILPKHSKKIITANMSVLLTSTDKSEQDKIFTMLYELKRYAELNNCYYTM